MINTSIVIALNILKAFDKMWHRVLLHKITSYDISARIINSLLSVRSMKNVVSVLSSEAHEVNAGVT